MGNVKMKRVVGYARISSDSQIENTSIAEQVKKIEAYCISQGWELTGIFKDEGESGSTTEREGYRDMMQYVQQAENEVTGIVVVRADRIHRRLRNLILLIEDELEPKGIAFISVSENFDTSTLSGMMFLQMIGSFSEFERKTINERTKGGRIATAKGNKYADGAPAYGYQVHNGMIIINEQQAQTVKNIFQLYVEGNNPYKIACKLNRAGIRTKTGKDWTVVQVQNILNNETYTGFNTYNGQKERNGIRQKDVFPRIISRQLWNKARQVS